MRIKIRKLITLLTIFLFFALFDFYLILKLINSYYFVKKQEEILSEINNIQKNFNQFSSPQGHKVLGTITTEIKLADVRVANLKSFFRKYNSPLYDYAEIIVRVSDKYGFDYRLLPAIAMQESTLCKFIPENSHNCWGYGIYGDQVLKFSSYEEAIETVARGIKKNYLDHGLTTPELVMKKYTPSSPGSWARGVNYFIKLLE